MELGFGKDHVLNSLKKHDATSREILTFFLQIACGGACANWSPRDLFFPVVWQRLSHRGEGVLPPEVRHNTRKTILGASGWSGVSGYDD